MVSLTSMAGLGSGNAHVDTSENLATRGLHVLDGDGALAAVALAVAAGTVELAEVLDGEAVNGHRRGAVVLDDLLSLLVIYALLIDVAVQSVTHLVISAASTTAGDLGGTSTLEGESILADGSPPDVLDRAAALTVDTLDLVLADDDVLEGSAVLQEEDGIRVATFLLTSARDATAVGLVPSVEGATDLLGFLVGHGALRGRDVEGEAALDELRCWGSGGSNGESTKEGSGDEAEGRHLAGVEYQSMNKRMNVAGLYERVTVVGSRFDELGWKDGEDGMSLILYHYTSWWCPNLRESLP